MPAAPAAMPPKPNTAAIKVRLVGFGIIRRHHQHLRPEPRALERRRRPGRTVQRDRGHTRYHRSGRRGTGAQSDPATRHIREKHPEIYIRGGIMERGNFSAAAGSGSSSGKQGIFGTFSAFLEMCISEITMARLNFSNVLAHFSHSGVDDMGDNTCHFGINSMYADGGVTPGHSADTTSLYFPVDQHQFAACVRRIYQDPGLRFVFSTRAPVPDILDIEGKPLYQGRSFEPGKDYIVREAPEGGGYVIATGETVYRALDALISLQEQGVKVGLVNKPTLNVVDDEMMRRLSTVPFVLVVEGWNVKKGLGSRFGSYLLQAGFKGKYHHIGTHKEGSGGQWQQMGYQGLDPQGIVAAVQALL
jgi:transketolase C-terminal domain/subunit